MSASTTVQQPRRPGKRREGLVPIRVPVGRVAADLDACSDARFARAELERDGEECSGCGNRLADAEWLERQAGTFEAEPATFLIASCACGLVTRLPWLVGA